MYLLKISLFLLTTYLNIVILRIIKFKFVQKRGGEMANEVKLTGSELVGVRKVRYADDLAKRTDAQLKPLDQKIDGILSRINETIKQLSQSIDSKVKELESEYVVEDAKRKAEWEEFKVKREEVWKYYDDISAELKQAEAEDNELNNRRFVLPGAKKKSEKKVEQLRQKTKNAKLETEKYPKGTIGISSPRYKELWDLLHGRRRPLRESLLRELSDVGDQIKRLDHISEQKSLDKIFPEAMAEIRSLQKELESVVTERRAVKRSAEDIKLDSIAFEDAKSPEVCVDESDLSLIEQEASIFDMEGRGSRDKTAFVSEDGGIDWSLKENLSIVCDHVSVRAGVIICPESISTLPVESAVHVMRLSNFEELYMGAINEQAYLGISDVLKQKYPTFEAWKGACKEAFKAKKQEVELYKQAKKESWREIENQAAYHREYERKKPELMSYNCPSHIFRLWFDEESKKPSSKGLTNKQILEMCEKRWHNMIRERMKALVLARQVEESSAGAGQLGEE